MTMGLVTIGPSEMLAEARRKIDKGNSRRLSVVKNGQLVGIITDRDLRGWGDAAVNRALVNRRMN